MLIFKNTYDLQQLNQEHPFNHIIREHLSRTGHLEGYLILIEKGDTYINLPELNRSLEDIQWEGVSKVSGFCTTSKRCSVTRTSERLSGSPIWSMTT